MNKAIPFKSFGNRLIFIRKELNEWVGTKTMTKPGKNTVLELAILKTGLGENGDGRKEKWRKVKL